MNTVAALRFPALTGRQSRRFLETALALSAAGGASLVSPSSSPCNFATAKHRFGFFDKLTLRQLFGCRSAFSVALHMFMMNDMGLDEIGGARFAQGHTGGNDNNIALFHQPLLPRHLGA